MLEFSQKRSPSIPPRARRRPLIGIDGRLCLLPGFIDVINRTRFSTPRSAEEIIARPLWDRNHGTNFIIYTWIRGLGRRSRAASVCEGENISCHIFVARAEGPARLPEWFSPLSNILNRVDGESGRVEQARAAWEERGRIEVRWSSFGVTRTTGSHGGDISLLQMHTYYDKCGGSGLPALCALTRACSGRSCGVGAALTRRRDLRLLIVVYITFYICCLLAVC